MRRALLRIAGILCIALGMIGIVLPILPTTPFALLAASCFAASSPKLYAWLIRNRYLGPFVENYRCGCGVPKKRKRQAIVFLWATLCVSAALFRQPLVWGILLIVGSGVTLHLALMKTSEDNGEPGVEGCRKESGSA